MNAKCYLLLSFVILLCSCNSIKKLYVKFGQAKTDIAAKQDGITRIYFDRKGTIYPDVAIKDEAITSYYSLLTNIYKKDKTLYKTVCQSEGLPESTSFEDLQIQLIRKKVQEINPHTEELVFLIHGFNKHPLEKPNESAFDEFKYIRDAITKKYPARHFYFVEIYWDGCTWLNGNHTLEWFNTFKIWDNAQAASVNVALQLRRILNQLNTKEARVITHSLGASVITCALFNVDKYKNGLFTQNIKATYQKASYQTPTAHYHVGLLAPAIPGVNTFDEFGDRTPANQYIYNCEFVVAYNRFDPALTKKVGIPRHWGATTLGCRKSEIERVKDLPLLRKMNVVDDVNFSYDDLGNKQKKHDISSYLKAKTKMDEFLNRVF